MDREIIAQTLKEAIRRAKRESTEKERFDAAWRECSEGLRFVHGAQLRNDERLAEAQQKYIAEQRRKRFLRRIIVAAGVVGFLVFLALAIMLFKRLRSSKSNYLFPETVWRSRYQGPHSGGGGIVVNYQRKKLK